jgi:putative transcriptional regulator
LLDTLLKAELSEATSINRVTLSKMVNQRGYSTVTDNLDRLCKYFNCKVSDIAEYVPDDEVGNP